MSALTPAQFRARFPILARRTYLNSCSQGALSLEVAEAFRAYADSWHDAGSPWDLWVEQAERLRAAFAASIRAEPDEVAIVPTASAGINAIASALVFQPPRPRVVMGEFEFPTMAQIWLAQQPRGATIAWVRAQADTLPVERYGAAIDDRTLIVPATHVCFRNGFRTDIAGLATICHERGAYLFLDDYQCTGSGPIDVHALGLDFMVTGCLKYLIGPSGVAMLYVRRDLIERLEPTITGWFGRVNPFEFRIDRLDWSPTARRFEAGTPPIPSIYGAIAGLDLLGRLGYDEIGRRVAALSGRFIDGALAAGYVVKTSRDPARRGPLVVLKSANAAELIVRLAARGVIGSSRGDGLRISFHAYNNESDVDAALAALAAESALVEKRGSGGVLAPR